MKKLVAASFAIILLLSGCSGQRAQNTDTAGASAQAGSDKYPQATVIELSGHEAVVNGVAAEEYDYTWHCDPSVTHDEVKDAPAEYYTGTRPETEQPVYIDSELYYYPMLPQEGFSLVNYDGEQEWAYYYNDGVNDEYIFATLPRLGDSLPSGMMHDASEAEENRVLHITKPGAYILRGSWKGQILVDLGDEEEVFSDPSMCVTLVLDGVDIDCSVAPGVVFKSVYECDNTWEEREEYSENVDTEGAGAEVIIADGSENRVSGTNIFRMLKTVYKDENSTDPVKVQKKMRKLDGAFYSYMTMNIDSEEEESGSLIVEAGFEGIDSELHLSVNGGNITVNSQDDGMNVNEDNVSVISFNGGEVTLNAGLGAEGDGIDSNGYIVINGGSLSVNGVTAPDSAMDSEDGVYYKSGTVTIDGQEQSYSPGDVFRESGRMGGPGGFGTPPEGGDFGGPGRRPDEMGQPFGGDFNLSEFKEKVANLPDDATIQDVLEILGMNRGGNPGMEPGQDPGIEPGQSPEMGHNPGQNPPEAPGGGV